MSGGGTLGEVDTKIRVAPLLHQNWLPVVPHKELARLRPMRKMPVMATWSSAHVVGVEVGEHVSRQIPLLLRRIISTQDRGSR